MPNLHSSKAEVHCGGAELDWHSLHVAGRAAECRRGCPKSASHRDVVVTHLVAKHEVPGQHRGNDFYPIKPVIGAAKLFQITISDILGTDFIQQNKNICNTGANY